MAGNRRKRKQTYEELIQQMLLAGYDKQFYTDHIDEYMIYYDNLQTLNNRMLDTSLDTRTFNEILKEKRQVTKEMRNILAFFNLQPTGETGSLGGEDDETL